MKHGLVTVDLLFMANDPIRYNNGKYAHEKQRTTMWRSWTNISSFVEKFERQ